MRVTTRPERSPADVAGLTTASVCVLAVAAAVATSTNYVLQPELAVVARDVGSSLPVIGVVAALPIGGYLFGLALLVPLADRVRPYRLISGQLAILAIGLVLEAIAATPLILGAGLLVSGACASTGAQMSSLASAGTAAGGSLVDLVGWTGIGFTATAALAVAASIVLLSGRTLAADR